MKAIKTRWFLALLCAAGGVKLMLDALKMNSVGAFGHVMGSVLAMVTVVLLISPETVFKVAEWCARPFTEILWPSDRLEKPPLNYRLARHYAQCLRLEEAIEEYRKIIHFYPDEGDAYKELIAVAEQLGDEEVKAEFETLYRTKFGA